METFQTPHWRLLARYLLIELQYNRKPYHSVIRMNWRQRKMVCTYSYGKKKILGAINRLVKWSAICYFWQSSGATGPSKGRLNHRTSYRAKRNNKGQWIQVDFGKVAKVTKIGTQGRYYHRQWVSKYTVSYSVNGGYFKNQLHQSSDLRRVSLKFYFILDRQQMA